MNRPLQHIHFIANVGAVMHNLAITVFKKGYKLTGSDDEVFEASKAGLRNTASTFPCQGMVP